MKEYSVDIPLSPSGPHFDDERTLRSAQPVVPLEKINAKVRHRQKWFLGGAFAIAMMLGAASALLASYWKLRHVPTTTAEVSEGPAVAPDPLAGGQTVAAAAPEPENLDAMEVPAEESVPAITPKKVPAVRHRTVAATRETQHVEPRDTQLSEEEELQRIRRAVLVDEWQERRARRVERRERRREQRYNHRDLSNLDEIFEGRRRPD